MNSWVKSLKNLVLGLGAGFCMAAYLFFLKKKSDQ